MGLLVSACVVTVAGFELDEGDDSKYVPNAYVVEMDSLSALGRRSGESVHESVYRHMERRGILFDVKNEYDTPDIMVGASMNLKDLEKVRTVPGVRHIQPVLRIRRPLPIHHTTIESPTDPNIPKNALSTHLMTGVDKVHAKGLFGEGIRIGMRVHVYIAAVDTGVDYTHPSLGGKLGKGHKVIGGHDFVGDHYNGTNDPMPDEDPLDQCSGHGTHSAGIIGADPGNIFGISGVAYKASLGAYRVFGCNGSTSDALIVGALIRAYNDGMDVITLSLGGVDGWTEGMGSVVASRIASHGRVVIVAAGNEGSVGSWYTSSPSNGVNTISVGSVDNAVIPTQNITVKGVEHNPISYLQALPLNVTGDLPIYATSNDTTTKNDACEPLPPSTPDLSSHIVVIHRGGCFFTQKLDNAAKFGAKTFLIYNTDDGEFSGIAVGNYTAVLITADDGKWLVNQYAAGIPLRLHFPAEGAPFNIPDPKGGLVSSFSSYGPTYDMYFKPALVAPGGNILSTYNTKNGSWAVRSGTSMAAPFVAGASALFLEAKGKSRESVERMRDLMQTTAVGVKFNVTEDSVYQTASQQGAGLLQVDRAIWTKTIVRPGQLMLNDTVNFISTHAISISNSYTHPVTYKLSHVPAGTALTIQAVNCFTLINSSEPSKGPVPLVPEFATAEIQPSEVTIRPGHSKDVTIKFAPPNNVNPKQLPVYSGFIRIASPDEALKVTYLGAVGSLRAEPIIDQTEQYFGPGVQLPIVLDADALPQLGELNYSMQKHDYPSVAYRLTFGSPLVRLDLVDKDFAFQKHAKTKRSAMWFEDAGDKDTLPTLGPLDILRYTPRNGYDAEPKLNGYNHYTFRGFFANRTRVDNGQYRILLRSLRVTGDRNSEADTESWLSPVIGVNHQPIPL
ncbi:pyrolysin [Pleurotus eryngii]|uniref:Pyrolysin n=1 Tax=Pleurotus eryngii TaxID=5323 RepID=A0A9P5ZJ88_PLEER|nr:pyrolysin [Pleurotus eryngii]